MFKITALPSSATGESLGNSPIRTGTSRIAEVTRFARVVNLLRDARFITIFSTSLNLIVKVSIRLFLKEFLQALLFSYYIL